jgi:hypothetical protein
MAGLGGLGGDPGQHRRRQAGVQELVGGRDDVRAGEDAPAGLAEHPQAEPAGRQLRHLPDEPVQRLGVDLPAVPGVRRLLLPGGPGEQHAVLAEALPAAGGVRDQPQRDADLAQPPDLQQARQVVAVVDRRTALPEGRLEQPP